MCPSKTDVQKRLVDCDRIRWIAFDAVGTLIFADPPPAVVYYQVGRKYGSRLNEQEIRLRFAIHFRQEEMRGELADRSAAAPADSSAFQTSEEHERQFWQTIVSSVLADVEDPDRCFEELFQHFARPCAWQCYQDVHESLRELRRQKYQLAIASNFDGRLDAVCDGHPSLASIKLRVISSRVGYRKPSDHFYRFLAEQAGCRPCEILMVGDHFHNDVQAARRCGLRALRIRRRNPSRKYRDDIRTMSSIRELLDLLGP